MLRRMAILNGSLGHFGPKMALFGPKNALIWGGGGGGLVVWRLRRRAPLVSFWLKTWIWQGHHSVMVIVE